ncbi:hypothetical protein Hdeb2414_s0007g00256391 [Helianthus debilis subsp. tardiflorus]
MRSDSMSTLTQSQPNPINFLVRFMKISLSESQEVFVENVEHFEGLGAIFEWGF